VLDTLPEDISVVEKESSVEPLGDLIKIVAGYMTRQSDTEAFKFADQKHRKILRAQLCIHFDKYCTGTPL
jgi:hypothetical protein